MRRYEYTILFLSLFVLVMMLAAVPALILKADAGKGPEISAMDPGTEELLKDRGIDTKALTIKDKKANVITYEDPSDPGRCYAVVSQTPFVDPSGKDLDPRWYYEDGAYIAAGNTFDAMVTDSGYTYVSLPFGNYQEEIPAGSSMYYAPSLYIGNKEIKPGPAVLLAADYYGAGYSYNCITWDYGVCTRLLRVIEGQLQGRWIFYETPAKDVTVVYHQAGSFPLILGSHAVNDDTEVFTAADIALDADSGHGFPVTYADTLTVYPDADPETNSVDGESSTVLGSGNGEAWAALVAEVGDHTSDADVNGLFAQWTDDIGDDWRTLRRSMFLFDTSSLPDTATVTYASLSVVGKSKQDSNNNLPTANVYSSNPASVDGLIAADFSTLGSTPFSGTPVTYANWPTDSSSRWAWVFNAAGKAAISTTGVTKLGVRFDYDVNVSAPAWSGNGDGSYIEGYFAEVGEEHAPRLYIEYSVYTLPSITSACPSNITETSATLHATITDDGDSTITRRGFYYGTSGTPTAADSDVYALGSFGTGSYSNTISALSPATVYYVRPYAVNVSGTGYGSVVSFSTDWQTYPAGSGDNPYYIRIDVSNDGASLANERVYAPINAAALVDNGYCLVSGADLVAKQGSSGIPLSATEMDGDAAVWLLQRETLDAGEQVSDFVWMGSGSGSRDQQWIGDAEDVTYAVDDPTLDAINSVDITAYISVPATPSGTSRIVTKPGNYDLSLTATPAYVFRVTQGTALVTSGSKTVSGQGHLTEMEGEVPSLADDQRYTLLNDSHDTTYIWQGTSTSYKFDLYQIEPTIPDGSVITNIKLFYRAKISSTCGAMAPVIWSRASGLIAAGTVTSTGAAWATGSATFTDTVSSDVQIGVGMKGIAGGGCDDTTTPRVAELYASITYTAPGTTAQVTISATVGLSSSIHAYYDGSHLGISDLGQCSQSQIISLSGTMPANNDPLYVGQFDGYIDGVTGTIDGSAAFSYTFDPEDISADTIDDHSGQGNDLLYSLYYPDDIGVTVNGVVIYDYTYFDVTTYSGGTQSGISVPIPAAPTDLTGDDQGYNKFPGAPFINDMLDGADVPRSAFWLSAFFAFAAGGAFFIFKFSRDVLGIIILCMLLCVLQGLTRMGVGIIDIICLLVCFAGLYIRREISRGQLS